MDTAVQQCIDITPEERKYVQAYAGNLYGQLNKYLCNVDTLQTYRRIAKQELAQNLYHLITSKPNIYINDPLPSREEKRVVTIIQAQSGNIEWFRHLMFQFAILLHSIILKCPKQHQEVEVYRGVETHYLKESLGIGHFLNTFTSTTLNMAIAQGFSTTHNGENFIYHFFVQPDVASIYIGREEDEYLINAYQVYSFIKKEGNHYYYKIHSSSIIPPNNELEFEDFKRAIVLRTASMQGGNSNTVFNHATVMPTEVNSTVNGTRRSNHRNKRNTKKNEREIRSTDMTPAEHFRARMNLPMASSSFGIPLTAEQLKDNERYIKMIDERIRNGTYYALPSERQ